MVNSKDPTITTIDEELSQSRARVVITAICLVAFSVIGVFKGLDRGSTLVHGLVTIVCYLTFAAAWYIMVNRFPGKWPWRRYITIMADLGIMTYWLHMGDRHVASYYPIFLWVIIGNGIRFGEKYLKIAIAMGAMGFGSLLLFNDFWKSHLEIGAGLLLGVLVLPIFFLTVLRRLQCHVGTPHRPGQEQAGRQGQGPVPGHDEPRDPHAHERRAGHGRNAGRH